MSNEETIATYEDGGKTYEVDHLGIGYPETQWGNFAVYCDGEMVAEFVIPESVLKPEFRASELPITIAELIEHAKGAVAGDFASDEEVALFLAAQSVVGRGNSTLN